MMNVGLATSDGSRPRPAATPFARTVFPAPSSPDRASTSPGFARRARRSPIRSVCSEDCETRSTVLRRSSLGFFEFAALMNEPNGKPEERSEERGPDEKPHVRFQRAQRTEVHPRAAAERYRERDEPEEADERAAPREALLSLLIFA